METIQLRPSAPSPIQDDLSPTANKHIVIFKHPGYPDEYEQNILLQLYAWDSSNGGLHAGTALLACAVIACNAWNGYLTVERDGPKLELQDDDVLSAQEYYFHVPQTIDGPAGDSSYYKYPVYPSFQHWAFPHRQVPSQWRGVSGDESEAISRGTINTPSVSSVSAAVISRDRSCVISKNRDYIERAHLCPRNELDWFRKNGMRRYNARLDISGDVITDDIANALAMRADIHRAFDECKFALVRKSGRWTVHFLEKTYDLGRMYHNRPIEVVEGVSPEFILTRFAWAVFPLVKAFMEHGPERVVKLREQCDDGFHEIVKTLDATSFEQITAASRRSSSPKKRKAAEALPPIPEVKRFCRSLHYQTDQMPAHTDASEGQIDEERTPNLSSDDGSDTGDEAEIERLSVLRMTQLRKHRPRNPAIICCDYSLAERANTLGIPGRPEYGGGHLCSMCLGLESA